VFNVLFIGYSLAKNNLNNTYQYNMIYQVYQKKDNELFKIQSESFFVPVSVYTERVLFSCKIIWMSSGGGPDPLDPPLIYATVPKYLHTLDDCIFFTVGSVFLLSFYVSAKRFPLNMSQNKCLNNTTRIQNDKEKSGCEWTSFTRNE
jgi:hypothetical protein